MTNIDRKRGALLGLAIGDALGAAVEFMMPGEFEPVTGYRTGGPHGLNLGEWTDDTSMALALATSIGKKGWDVQDQLDRYVDWWQNGAYAVNGWCFDIGGTTKQSLATYMETGRTDCASTDEDASGNGSIMRLAPVPIFYSHLYPNNIPELMRLLDESSKTTHASTQCRSACQYLGLMLAALIEGEDKETVLSPDWPKLLDVPVQSIFLKENIEGGWYKDTSNLKGSGWVVASLEAALGCFHDAQDFEKAVLMAVNLGDDADTTGAVCGQLAGACWGESGIPDSLLQGLAKREMIEDALALLGCGK